METKYIVNNATGQTINGSVTINGDLTVTGDTSVRPYKVYTALLTQSGGDNPLDVNTGELTIGVTYLINDSSAGMDFTNVGAPNNDVGTYFVATGTIPNSWGIDEGGPSILLYNTGAPVVTVLENTIGNIFFLYSSGGFYTAQSNQLFIVDKTFTFIGSRNIGAANSAGNNYTYVSDSSTINIETTDFSSTPENGNLYYTSIEIRVYN